MRALGQGISARRGNPSVHSGVRMHREVLLMPHSVRVNLEPEDRSALPQRVVAPNTAMVTHNRCTDSTIRVLTAFTTSCSSAATPESHYPQCGAFTRRTRRVRSPLLRTAAELVNVEAAPAHAGSGRRHATPSASTCACTIGVPQLKWSRNPLHVSGTPTTLGGITFPDVSPKSLILKFAPAFTGTVDKARRHSSYTA